MWEKSKRNTKCEIRFVACNVGTTQCENETVKCEKKNKEITEYDKRTFTCDVGTTQYEDGTIKCEKKSKGTNQCDKRTVTYDKRTVTCNKNRPDVMLVMLNMTIELSNLRKKIKNYHIWQYKDGTIKCKKKS